MKRPDTLDPYGENLIQVVSCLDEAIDWTAVDTEAYAKTRDWELLKPGLSAASQPTIYHLRLLTVQSRAYLADTFSRNSSTSLLLQMFLNCVARIDNLRRTDGASVASWVPSKCMPIGRKQKSVPTISGEELEFLGEHLGMEILVEIGGVANVYNFLHPKKPTNYPLPHSLEPDITTSR